jgi:hypothetical protein
MSRSQFSRDRDWSRDRSRKSGPNSVGAGARAVWDGSAFLGAGADFRSRLRDCIYNGIHHNVGIKYIQIECMKKSEPAPERPEP